VDFHGLSAFPLTPLTAGVVDERAFARLIDGLRDARVDSIGALGSTEQRRRVTALAVDRAGDIPVIIGIGALSTDAVLQAAADAQADGASGVLLTPVSYQPLTSDEVFGLYESVTESLSVPLCVYENSRTTGFSFDDDLLKAVCALPNVTAVKLPSSPADDAARRIGRLRGQLGDDIRIGIAGDAHAPHGIEAGADVWFSVIGGLFPDTAKEIWDAAHSADTGRSAAIADRLAPLYDLFTRFGSIRVVSAAAHLVGIAGRDNLPRPLRPLPDSAWHELRSALATGVDSRSVAGSDGDGR
jgi:4-hydroxy-tetrahydrodipicolinate synthase